MDLSVFFVLFDDVRLMDPLSKLNLSQVISDTFSDTRMPPAKVAEMFAEADWDGNGRVSRLGEEVKAAA